MTTLAQLADASYSSILQLLLDAEKPVRISVGDDLERMVRALEAVGLVDYRKSGWWRTSEKGLRFVAGSMGVGGFKLSLLALIEKVSAENTLLARPRGLTVKQRRRADHMVWGAQYLARCNARDEREPATA